MESVDIRKSSISFIPNQIFEKFPKLYAFRIIGKNGLKTLEENYFEGAKNLELISIQDQNITLLKNDVFKKAHQLKVLDLSHNGIIKIQAKAFRTNTNLKILNLGKNRLEKLHDRTFMNLFNLEELFLCRNKFVQFDVNFDDLLSLKRIIFKDNKLAIINEKMFQHKNLTFVNFVDCGCLLHEFKNESGENQIQNKIPDLDVSTKLIKTIKTRCNVIAESAISLQQIIIFCTIAAILLVTVSKKNF